jgi:hypothetical protein
MCISWLLLRMLLSMHGSTMKLSSRGRFIMYSGITKIYYRKLVGLIFTKPVPTEGATQKFFSPVSCFSSQFTFLSLGDASVCSEKMAALGEEVVLCFGISHE